jgi:hypothetical protein
LTGQILALSRLASDAPASQPLLPTQSPATPTYVSIVAGSDTRVSHDRPGHGARDCPAVAGA